MSGLGLCAVMLMMGATDQVEWMPSGEVAVTPGDVRKNKPSKAYPLGYTQQQTTIATGKVTYGLLYTAAPDPKDKRRVLNREGSFGMPLPCSTNWYHGGFLFVTVNKETINHYALQSCAVVEQGKRGIVDWIWDVPSAVVRVRALAEENSDHLKLQIRLRAKPKTKITRFSLSLRAYPSFFTSWHKRKGDRHVTTPTRDLKQGANVKLVPDKDWYLFLYDTIFDVAKGEGEGPCAMMVLPEQVASGGVQVGGYCVPIQLGVKPELDEVRLAFWDFNGMPNAEAMKSLQSRADTLQKALRETDFRSTILAKFDLAREKQRVARYLKAGGKKADALRTKAHAALDQVARLCDAVRNGQWHLSSQLADKVKAYDKVLWDIKFFELLHDL